MADATPTPDAPQDATNTSAPATTALVTETHKKSILCCYCGTHLSDNQQQVIQTKIKSVLSVKNIHLILTIASVIIGCLVGILLSQFANLSKQTLAILNFPGEMLLRALNCLIVPLIVSSMVTSMTSLGNLRSQGKIGVITLIYYCLTTFLAVILGIVLVNVIRPGVSSTITILPINNSTSASTIADKCKRQDPSDVVETIFGVIRGIVPRNLVDAASNVADCQMNILGLIVFSLTLGGVLASMEVEKAKPLIGFFDSLNEAMMKMVMIVIMYAPIGIMFLIIGRFAKESGGKIWTVLSQLGWYVLTVILGLTLHLVITLTIIYLVFTRKNPLKHYIGIAPAFLTAIGTSSSSATLPLTLRCCQENLGLKPNVCRFVIPLGATINMDGTALYEAVAAIFMAQALGIQLSFGQNILVTLTATLASIGAAGIPEAGLVTLVMVVQAIGLPTEAIGLILAVDWFLDRCRTAVNVAGDTIGAAVVDSLLDFSWKKKAPVTVVAQDETTSGNAVEMQDEIKEETVEEIKE